MYNSKRYFISRALVLCLLVVPLILTLGPLHLEPYPAVILPGGGKPKKFIGSEFRFQYKLRFYMLVEDAEVEFDYIQFFRPAPVPRYARYIMKNNFGLGKGGGGIPRTLGKNQEGRSKLDKRSSE